MRKQLKILAARLPEPEAWVENQLRAADARRKRPPDGGREPGAYRAPHRASKGFPLHGLGPAAQMHQDQRRTRASGDARDFRVKGEATDVVDDASARFERRVGHRAFRGVNGNRDLRQSSRQRADDGQDAAHLFLSGNRTRAGARGLAAHVNPIGALAGEFHAAADGAGRVEIRSTIRKRVGRNVHHAHDERAAAELHLAAGNADFESRPHSYFKNLSRKGAKRQRTQRIESRYSTGVRGLGTAPDAGPEASQPRTLFNSHAPKSLT